MNTTMENAQFLCFGHFSQESDTPRAENASLLVMKEIFSNVDLLLSSFLVFFKLAIEEPMLFVIILELAFSRFIADRTIDRMLCQEAFQNSLSCLNDSIVLSQNLHSFSHPS